MNMKATASTAAALAFALVNAGAQAQVNPTDPQPTCTMCPGTYIPLAELESYTKKAIAEKLVDQQVRDIDIGKSNIGIGMVHRGRLEKPAPNSVAEHDQISEVYHIISESGTLAGTGHWFTRIDDHIDYLMIRIDPDKVTPLKSEAQSKEYLSKPARWGN